MLYNQELYNVYYIQLMTTYHSHKVNLSEGQTKKLLTAIKNNNPLTLRLSNQDLSGNDTLMLTQRQINKLTKANI